MRVLALGGRGFIGRHVVAALASRGHEVVAGTRHPDRATAVAGVSRWVGSRWRCSMCAIWARPSPLHASATASAPSWSLAANCGGRSPTTSRICARHAVGRAL